jgi:hypothetical protein
MKPNQLGASPTHQGLFNDIENITRGAMVWEISGGRPNKTNKQTITFLDR